MKERLTERLTDKNLLWWAKYLEEKIGSDEETKPLIDGIFSAAEQVVVRMNTISPNPYEQRTGGVMVVARRGDEPFIVVREVGKAKKIDKYTLFALGKGVILAQNPDATSSRVNVELEVSEQLTFGGDPLPGGAFTIDENLIIGFSGYSVEDDEAVVLATAVLSGLLSWEESADMALSVSNLRYVQVINNLLPPVTE
jgi:hypothetical protein